MSQITILTDRQTDRQTDRGYDDLKEKCDSGMFEHYISLGHCCFVAMDLESMGLRDASLPFDWTRTRWKAVARSFATRFNGILEYNSLYQKKNNLLAYKNLDYGIGFFHDFNQFDSLKSQLDAVQKKYDKRIKRFFQFIEQPTLFIRYCWDEDELFYISKHYSEILNMVKQENQFNEIVFISHDPYSSADLSDIDYLFFIDKAKDSELNEQPIKTNSSLFEILNNATYGKRTSNLQFEEQKKLRKSQERKTIKSRVKRKLKHWIPRKEYIHTKQC